MLFFAYKNVTQSVRVFVYKNVTESALFFEYNNLTQSTLFFVHTPPSTNLKNSKKNCVTQSVSFLYIKKRNAYCLDFFEVSGFLYIKTSCNAKCHDFCIYINAKFKNFMKNRVKQSVWIFVNKNVTQIVLLFSKCLGFGIYT